MKAGCTVAAMFRRPIYWLLVLLVLAAIVLLGQIRL
jgi:hypothetical protein